MESSKENCQASRPVDQAAGIVNAMSIDVEDYFQTEAMSDAVPRGKWSQTPTRVEQNVVQLLELFAARKVRATFFFLGWVAERFPRLVREARDLGHEIACHSHWHRPIYSLSAAEFREDTRRAKQVIEDAAGSRVFGYRAPSFSLTPGTEWAEEILEEAGFIYDSSVHPVPHDLYDNRHAPRHPYRLGKTSLIEIPISTLRLGKRNFAFSGGGYFRMFPYSYIRWSFGRMHRLEERPAVFYLHPWEIDPGQPRLAASRRSRLRQYSGLGRTLQNLDRLMKDFRFAPVREAFARELAGLRIECEMTSVSVSVANIS